LQGRAGAPHNEDAMRKKHVFSPVGSCVVVLVVALVSLQGACGPRAERVAREGGEELSGTIAIDGSSTVYPISAAMAEEFQKRYPGVTVTVGISGTGGGFKKFLHKEIDISDASRPIKKEELEQAQQKGIEFMEIPVAYDGLVVVVNKENNWVDHLTVEELKRIWEPGSKVKKWSDIRPQWPQEPIRLFGPGTDSGTFDYFTEVICGKSGASRADYTASEDDNVIVSGVVGEKYSLGYFGIAYYEENKDRLRAIPIDGGKGPVSPSLETVRSGAYSPLSRPLFIYVRKESYSRPEVKKFVEFYLSDEAKTFVKETGYIPLPDDIYVLVRKRVEKGLLGSIFVGTHEEMRDLSSLLSKGL
jgi:phosphate transport system substrate-binding protein